jgi:hypothetical protein
MNFLYEKITYIFDPLHYIWEHEKMHRKISIALVLFFLTGLMAIELKRQGYSPALLSGLIPNNHFYAVQAAFTVVLILEVISLVFTLPCSFSRSVGKQFEILSLILMRNAFKSLAQFPEPVTFIGNEQAVLQIVSDGFGALIIFAMLGYYYLVQGRASDEAMKPADLFSFVAAKKGIALILLVIFIFLGANSIWMTATHQEQTDFLYDFYTILILTDILVVLISECFHPSFYTVFRNSGFALSTLLIRLALAAPAFFNVLLGVAAALFAILLTKISGRLFTEKPGTRKGRPSSKDGAASQGYEGRK